MMNMETENKPYSSINKSEAFVEKAKAIHGARYMYHLVRYENSDKKVEIVCSIHGVFTQRPINHLRGSGCTKCGYATVSKKLSGSGSPRDRPLARAADFVSRAVGVHGEKYDYSRVSYKRAQDKIEIICLVHGAFLQQPNNHLSGNGCPACSMLKVAERLSLPKHVFLARMSDVFGENYDFSSSEYINSQTKVRAFCKLHGGFEQYALHLQRGVGCPGCGTIKRQKHFQLTVSEFKIRAEALHKGRYNYKFVQFDNLRKKIKIECPKHGFFEQVAYSHLVGSACPRCRNSLGEKAVSAWLDLNGVEYVYQYADHDCIINTHRAKFDFFIPSAKVIIEYDGEQHFKPVLFGGGIERALGRFEQIKKADQIKNNWATKNEIVMIRVPYSSSVTEYLDFYLSTYLDTVKKLTCSIK